MKLCSPRRGGGLSSRLDYIPVKRGSIAAASDDSQNADDSVDGEEDATKWINNLVGANPVGVAKSSGSSHVGCSRVDT